MKQFVKTILTVIAIVAATNTFAQTGYDDVIYLKNGSIIHGTIIEQVPNESIKIKTSDNNVFVFKMDEIEKITKEKKAVTPHKYGFHKDKPAEPPTDFKHNDYTGYSLTIESQLGIGSHENTGTEFSMAAHVINGATIKGMFFIGAGLGLDFMMLNTGYNYGNNINYYSSYESDPYLFLPIYLDLRVFPVKGRVSPLFIFDYGYSSALVDSKVKGGMLLNTGLGARLAFSKRMALNLSFNYKIQKVTVTNNYHSNTNYHTEQELNPKLFCLTIGLSL